MLYTVKWLACVATAILAWPEADAYPSAWKKDVTSLSDITIAGNSVHQGASLPGVCDSEICRQDAKQILESLDKSVDPCDDFYLFTCGGWKEKHPPTNDTPIRDNDSELLKQLLAQVKLMLEEPVSEDDISPLKAAKTMYKVCMDVEAIERAGIQPLVDLSNELGGWPMAREHWNEEQFNLESTLADFERQLAWSPFFYAISSYNVNGTLRRVEIAENTRHLPDIDLLGPEYEEKREKYEGMIANMTFHIMKTTGVDIDEESVLLQSSQIVEFIIQLKNLSSEYENQTIETLTLKELQNWTDTALVVNAYAQINWLSYLNKILSDTEIVLDEDERIDVMDTAYWIRLFQLLDNTPPRVIANYLQWSLILSYKNKTEMWMTDRITEDKNLTRSMHCIAETHPRFNHAINSKLVANFYNEDDKKHLNILVEDIHSELIKTYSNITWLDDDSRSQIIKRVETMKVHSGYPDLYKNDSALLDYYKQVNVSNVHFTNMLLDKPTRKYQHFGGRLPFLRHPVYEGHEIWELTDSSNALFVNYISAHNCVVIPFGVLPSFYFKVGRMEAVQYGIMGAIIGHETMHGITTIYGEKWNSNTSRLFYDDQCIVDHYDNYHIPELETTGETNITLNGTNTLEENVADIYGLATAFEAYQTYVQLHGSEERLPELEEYSPDQLLYISFGMSWCESRIDESMAKYLVDVHSPPYARVRASISNMEHFGRVFNCPAGSNMNPDNKCRLWGPSS